MCNFRNGDYLAFDGDLNRPVEVVNWLTGTDALEVVGIVEEVTEDMLDNIIELEDDVLVFFYDEEDGDVDDIMTAMESIGKPKQLSLEVFIIGRSPIS